MPRLQSVDTMVDYPFSLIHHFLEKSACLYPAKVALVHEDIRATYAEINAGANRLAHWLVDQGIQQGERVVLLLENSLEYVISYYGSLKAGAVVVPLSSDLKPEGLKSLLKELEPKIIISSSKFEKHLRAIELKQFSPYALILQNPILTWSSVGCSVFKWEELIPGEDLTNPNLSISEKNTASIIYTSGSAGRPKGEMLSHNNIVSNTLSICQYLQLAEDDIQAVVLPFYYVMGKSLLNTHFAVSGRVVINNKFAFPASVLNSMVEEEVTGFSGVPSTYAHLLHRSPIKKYCGKLTSLRYCSQAGGHMSRATKEELRRTLPPHTDIYIMYGATEASARLSYLSPNKFKEKMDSIGKAIPGVSLKVIDGKAGDLPPGEIGELVASGDNIMQGYWRDQEATARVLDERGYRTGDLAYRDKEGYFFIVGRKDHLLKVGGRRINPIEVEDVLMGSGHVTETVVLGIDDQLLGHKLVALIALKNNHCSSSELLKHCAKNLPKYKLPSEIKLVPRLPHNTSGKVDRSKCLELLRRQ